MAKRIFDIIFSILLLLLFGAIIFIGFVLTSIDTASNGLFFQRRVGQHGTFFTIYKLKTIHPRTRKISSLGKLFRKYKIDELPQLYNVLIGNMSFVGPRPDISGYYDNLHGEDRKILELKPGITSLASIKYKNEEEILSRQEYPLEYNDTVLFPDKIKMNLDYYYHRTFFGDIKIIIKTIFR